MTVPLKKLTRDGTQYVRDPRVESEISALAVLSDADLVARCAAKRSSAERVSLEALLHFVRDKAGQRAGIGELLFKLLVERILHRLPRGESSGGQSITTTVIREKTFDRFVDMLIEDKAGYCERLDFFETRFDAGFARLRGDARKQAWRDENRSSPLEEDDDGEISTEVEQAVGSWDPFDADSLDQARYRSRLDEAIDSLPHEQRRIIEMLRLDIPIDSKDPAAQTISKVLGKSERTIRTHRDKAYVALRTFLSGRNDA